MRRGAQHTNERYEAPGLAVMPQPGGPSAKNARRAGSPNHQRNTSEEIPMVEPNSAERGARLARLERVERRRLDTAVARAVVELTSAYGAWGLWADTVWQLRALALGQPGEMTEGPASDDPEYLAALRVSDPVVAALNALADFRSRR